MSRGSGSRRAPEPPTRTLARQLIEAGMPPAFIKVWLETPQGALDGRTPKEVIQDGERAGSVLDAWAMVIGVAYALRERPCGRKGALEEDGRCPCGEYHLERWSL